ncbi:50S ribosomal protein L34 [Candidatus Parcubacteria bacterium]|nr:50S ribosomal protein L34 [Candidatus Parcubacteria bacterium]
MRLTVTKKRKRHAKHGFRARQRSNSGTRVLRRRRSKRRKKISI